MMHYLIGTRDVTISCNEIEDGLVFNKWPFIYLYLRIMG